MPQTDKGHIIGAIIAGTCAIIAAIVGALLTYYLINQGNNSNNAPSRNTVVVKNNNRPENSNRASNSQSANITAITLKLKRNNQISDAQLSDVFTKDDGIRLHVSLDEKGFLYIFYKGSEGDSRISFPDGQSNTWQIQVEANQIARIPDGKWWFFDGKKGVEKIYIVFSKTRDGVIGQDETTGRQITPQDKAEDVVHYLERIHSNVATDAFMTSNGNLVRVISLLHR